MDRKKPSSKDIQAVSAVVSNAEAGAALERMRARLDELTGNDFPAVASLLGLLAEHPKVAGDVVLFGAVYGVLCVFRELWENTEQLAG